MIRRMQSDSIGGDGWPTRRRVSLLLLTTLIPMFIGCKTWGLPEELSSDQFLAATALDPTENRIVGVTTTAGEDVAFGLDPEAASVRRDTIYGYVSGEPYQVALSDAERVWVSWHETDTGKTVLPLSALPQGWRC